ncbi:hypothetical protein HY994_02425 [Candidatus Micrarchaeota archaeon]|nr:hypothetical protein [Candidatus Micrarchaeota archaeon]
MGFVWFASGFQDFTYERREESPQTVASLMADAHAILDNQHLQFAPIQNDKIKAAAPTFAKGEAGMQTFIDHVSKLKFGELATKLKANLTYQMPTDEAVLKKIGDPNEVTVCAYLHNAFRSVYPLSMPSSKPFAKKEVRLAADFDGWVAVKKVNLELAERKEVFSSLCSMRTVAQRKAMEFTPGFDEFNAALEGALAPFPERKSFGKLNAALNAVKGVSADTNLQSFAFSSAMLRVGYPPYLTNDHVASLYPELKVPKPKGNYGGKKKKK